MDAMATQPASLVEPVLGPTRLGQLSGRFDDGALWGRTPTRQPEQNGLPEAGLAEPKDERGSADVIAALLSRAGDDEPSSLGEADGGGQRTAVEGIEARAPPPPADENEADGERAQALPALREEGHQADDPDQSHRERGFYADGVCGRKAEADGSRE
jgi:hypothetical protein